MSDAPGRSDGSGASDGSGWPGTGTALPLRGALDGPAGAPVLVLGNSIGTTSSVWDPQVPVLGRHFRLLRFDYPGHGGSPAPAGPYSIADLAGGVLALLDAHGVDVAAYAGISLGGMVGMWLGAHAPGRISALALCCTSSYLDLGWAERAALVRSQGMAPVADATPARWFTAAFRGSDPRTVAAFMAEMRQVEPEGYAGCCDAIRIMDQRDSLPSVTAPTLVIAGAEDPATPPWHGAAIARRIAGSQLRVVHGASHLANVEQPAEVAALLLGHLLAG
jgi:3-oxoadipate enol-lactonase